MREPKRLVAPCPPSAVFIATLLSLAVLDIRPAAGEEPRPGMTPHFDYAGDWMTRPALTGDWGGIRQRLADQGVTLDLDWHQVAQGALSGGVRNRDTHVANFDYRLKLDLMRMGVLPGALLTLRGQSRFGKTSNTDSGLLLPVNTYSYFPYQTSTDEDVAISLTELNHLQFVTDTAGLLFGKITTMANRNEFAGGEGRSQFMNTQLLWSGVYAQIVPYSTLAVGGVWLPSPNLNVTTVLMNTTDASTDHGFDDFGDGTSWWTSADVQYQVAGLPGGLGVGAVYAFEGDFAGVGGLNLSPESGLSLESKSTSWAFHAGGWQYLMVEDEAPESIDLDDGRQDLQGIGAFWMYGIADRDTNPVRWSLSAGLTAKGLIPGRDRDTAGFGYFYNDLQDPRRVIADRVGSISQGIEFYYEIAFTRWASLTLDGQWTDGAIKRVDDAWLIGARLDVRL